jgi:hypothetical protein
VGRKNSIGCYCCAMSCYMMSFMYFHCARNVLNHENPQYLFKGSYLLLYIGIFKAVYNPWSVLEPNVCCNGVCVYTCWYHCCVHVGMFDFLKVTFRSETVEHVLCCRRAFCCYGHLDVGRSVPGLWSVVPSTLFTESISWLSYLHGDQFDPSHPPNPSNL